MAAPIALIGLGNMGEPIGKRILDAGFDLRVYNRTTEKAKALVDAGAILANSPAEAVEPGGIALTMVSDDPALDRVTKGDDGLLSTLGEGGVHVSLSTVAASTARTMEAEHEAVGARYLCSPVFGRPPAAAAGQLAIALSGDPAAKQRVRPVLEAFSHNIVDFGEAPGAANVVKLSGNFLIASAIEAVSEACALAEKSGVDRRKFIDLLAGSLFDCPVYHIYGEAIADRRYEPFGFRLSLGFKDVNLVLDAAADAEVPMPFASIAHDRLLSLMNRGHGDLDWTAVDIGVSEDAGTLPK